MNKYSVWYMPYNKKYLITHPWQWFRCAWRCIKDAWRRSVYGWTYGDVWDWDNWFIHTTPQMFRYMADHGSSYPGREPFTTPEKWHDWLYEIADLIETADKEWQDKHNEYHDEYMKELMGRWKPWTEYQNGKCLYEPSDLHKKHTARANELAKQGENNIRRALTSIGEHFHNLWD